MKVVQTGLEGLLVLEPAVFGDERGFFYESYNRKVMAEVAGITGEFVQDNHSRSAKNVLRGLHYQIRQPQGKLVRVAAGSVFDVTVDIRRPSPTFGKWVGIELSAENRRMLWIPPGFAHGFVVTSGFAEFLYKTTDFWAPQFERCIQWDDPALAIAWPLDGDPVISARDRLGVPLARAEVFES